MESIIARALEYTLKYWLKSFSRDQFKLQGMTVQLSDLDINGDALHASMGLPPAINVTTAKVGKLVIMLPSLSYVQVEPIVVQIDRLDLVLEENSDADAGKTPSSAQSSTSSGKGSGYGFADKIADGMTVEVGTVNLLLETRGGAQREGGATWASPLASITIRNLLLYTTNEHWQVVNLKEARDFSTDKKFIYLFKKLEWESLSIDLLPHPDMFMASWSEDGSQKRDDDGAKRVFFGGERFIEGISGQAYITVQRTELNSPLGLEVQLHISEVVCPALSEPGLRALLRFMTGFYVCLNRGDVDPKAQQRSTEAAGRSLVSIVVDHIFVCIKDAEFRLELLMQSLFFSRASVSDGEKTSNLTRIMISGLFLRDPFSNPPCTLVQPSMQAVSKDPLQIPDFGRNFCPPIYPLGDQQWQLHECMPLFSLHSLQVKPSPAPPSFASQTVISCQPLMIYLQEESCLRISSFLADGIVVNPGAAVLPDFSVNSLVVTLKELDISVPLDKGKLDNPAGKTDVNFPCSFSGARLHLENMFLSESPALKPKLLHLEKDPACFCLWEGQPIDASQNKWMIGASNLSLSLETSSGPIGHQKSHLRSSDSWRCVELKNACIEVAMATADGRPLVDVPPPGGIVRVGVSCQQYVSNTSIEQLFFVLDLYSYFGQVAEKIAAVGKKNRPKISRTESFGGKLIEKVPSDSAVSLGVEDLQLRFLEPSSTNIQGMPLVQFMGEALTVKVSHRTLGGAIAVSSTVRWESVEVDCVETEENMGLANGTAATALENGIAENGHPQLRAVFWINKKLTRRPNGNFLTVPFLDINMVQMIPYRALDIECHSLSVSACIAGVRLGGGMNYAEALLHRFGILGPDGGPGEGLSKGLEHLAAGPLSKLLKAAPLAVDESEENGKSEDALDSGFSRLGKPDDVDVSIELKDWLFALEGAQEMSESVFLNSHDGIRREDRCWHTTFQSLQFKAKTCPQQLENGNARVYGMQREPVESITVSVEGLQALKPQPTPKIIQSESDTPKRGINETVDQSGGINAEVGMVIANDEFDLKTGKWVVENLKFSVKQPVEAVVTKGELQHLAFLCKSEVDSMGRIAAGVLRVLKLEESVGQAAIDQLSNLGSEGFDKIFTPNFTPKNLSRGNSTGSLGIVPSSTTINEAQNPNILSTVTSLEEAVLDSQAKCAVLMSELNNSEPSVQHIATIEQLTQKLENMQNLLTRLRIQL